MGQSQNLEKETQELQAKFEELLGSKNVYYNPPASKKMSYDAIVYTRSNFNNVFADDSVYKQMREYTVTVITEDPDAEIISSISHLPRCSFNRSFVSDNLNHNVFRLYC